MFSSLTQMTHILVTLPLQNAEVSSETPRVGYIHGFTCNLGRFPSAMADSRGLVHGLKLANKGAWIGRG